MKHCQRCSAPTRAKKFRTYTFCPSCREAIAREFDSYRRGSLWTYLGIRELRPAAPSRRSLAA